MANGLLVTLDATGNLPVVGAAVFGEAHLIPRVAIGCVPGDISTPSFVQLDNQPSGLYQAPWGEIVNKVWVVPYFLRPTNPSLLTDIPFIIWASFSTNNVLMTVTGTGQTGLTLDFTPPILYLAYAEKIINLQITSSAPPEVSAVFDFNFLN